VHRVRQLKGRQVFTTILHLIITLGRRLVEPWVAVTTADARPAVAEKLTVLGSHGRGHQCLFPDRPATAGPGALRPNGRSTSLVVLGGRYGGRAAYVPVRWRRGRGRLGAGQQVFGAAGWETERAYGRRPGLVVQQAVFLGRHLCRQLPSSPSAALVAVNSPRRLQQSFSSSAVLQVISKPPGFCA